jgi:hypothetical protein
LAPFRHSVWKWRIANEGILGILQCVMIAAEHPERGHYEDDRDCADNNPDHGQSRSTRSQHRIGLQSAFEIIWFTFIANGHDDILWSLTFG